MSMIQAKKDVAETQNPRPGSRGESDQIDKMRDFMHGIQKENAALHSVWAAEKAARFRSLLEVSALRVENEAQK